MCTYGVTAAYVEPFLKINFAVVDAVVDGSPEAADAAAGPKLRPEMIVAAASPAAPMDLRAVEALFL